MKKLMAAARILLALLGAGILLSLAILPFAATAGWAISTGTETMNSNLQDIGDNESLPTVSTMTDRDGDPIAYFYDQYRVPVESEQISRDMKESIVAIEDRRFYDHSGVDLRGTLRAMASNLSSGGVSEGASTLNQQYVKNYLLYISADSEDDASAATETSIPRKLREMKMASEVDKNFSKEEILTRYLNLVPYGQGAFGIEAAARTYFGIPAAELNAGQSAFLAGVVQSSSILDPYANPDAALQRRNAVLDARVQTGTLSPDQANAFKQEGLGVLDEPRRLDLGCIGAGDSGFFCDFALQWLENHDLPADKISQGGYTIKTTLDKQAQQRAVEDTRRFVDPKADGVASVSSYITPTTSEKQTEKVRQNRTNKAAEAEEKAEKEYRQKLDDADSARERRSITRNYEQEKQQRQHKLDVQNSWSASTSHQVRALASSRVYGLDTEQKETVYPLTHTMQGHGAGSVFKIFDAAAALQQGIGLDTMLNVPRRVEVSGMGDGGAEGCPPGKYCVENSTDYRPQMSLRDALATSPNTPFIEMAQTVGVDRIVDLSVDLGLRSYAEPGTSGGDQSIAQQMKNDNSASYVLGPTAVNPVELSNVAATLADGGRWCEPSPIISVTDRDGESVKFEREPCEQVIEKDVADALAHGMSSDVSTGGAAGSAAAAGWGGPISSKTGTTETNLSAAYLGFTPGWAGSTYIFNDGGAPSSLCSSPVRQCGLGDLFGSREPAMTMLSTSAAEVGRFGGPGLPPLDPRFLAGRDPEGYQNAFNRREQNSPTEQEPPLVPPLDQSAADNG